MGFTYGILFCIGAVVFSELFATGIALAYFHWLDKKERKRKGRKRK